MLSNLSNTFFPISSFIIALFLCFTFFGKKYVKNEETKIYSALLRCSLIESFLYVLLTFAVDFIYNPSLDIYFEIFNKILGSTYVIWTGLFFRYVYNLIHENENDKKRVKLITILFNIVAIFIMFVLPIDLYYDPLLHISNSSGSAINFLIFSCFIYILATIILVLFNINNEHLKGKLTPLYVLIIMNLISIVIRIIDPYFNITSNIMTLVLLFMYHTIENPDIKMIKELELARDQANRANQAKTNFLSSMSHEIRTPLNAIVGFSNCINNCSNLDEAKENAKDIINASDTLLEIVNGILDISKIEAGKIEIINSCYNARETFSELARLIKPKMVEKGLDFSYNIAPDLPNTLCGDHANLKKVITNLLSNASKYTEKGYVHYEVNCVNKLDVCRLIISVEDSGRGIKSENIDKLFTKFQRLEEDKNTTIEGTGLGLAISKQIVELMGGRIIVHTVYGEGSKFTIVVDQKIEKNKVIKEKKIKTTLDLNNVSILVVDDNKLNLKVVSMILKQYNANLLDLCDSGFLCIDKVKSGNKYDLILLDDMMPKMSGVETLKELKEIDGFDIPVIVLTANAITGMKEKYLADGFDDYLAKPIEKEELIKALNKVLEKKVTDETEILSSDDFSNNDITSVDNTNVEVLEKEVSDISKVNLIPLVDVSSSEDTNPFDKNYLESKGVLVDKALEYLGDMEMYNDTINDYLLELNDKWNNIKRYKDCNDMSNYAIEVHSLKSDSKYLGFMKFADILYQHELKSKENDYNYVFDNFGELEKEYHIVLDIVKVYVDHNKGSL